MERVTGDGQLKGTRPGVKSLRARHDLEELWALHQAGLIEEPRVTGAFMGRRNTSLFEPFYKAVTTARADHASDPAMTIAPADDTFATKTGAEEWLTLKEAEILEGEWIDPDAGAILVPDYAATWIKERPGLRPKTVLIYTGLLRCHIAPYFAHATVAEVTLGRVRRWRTKLLDSGVSEVTAAKAYRLLRAIFYTALDDGLIRRNPCRIKGADKENSPERPVLTVP